MSSRARGAIAWLGIEAARTLAAPVTNGISDGIELSAGAYDHAADGIRGSQGLVRVGGEWFHGPGDRAHALAQIGTDFQIFQTDITSVVSPHAPEDVAWVTMNVAPVIAEWLTFVTRVAQSKIAPYTTEWSVYAAWWERLHRLRDAARLRGIALASPEPVPLPKTVWQRGADGTGGSLDSAIVLGKTVVFAAIAITGLAGFYSVLRDVHGYVKDKKPR